MSYFCICTFDLNNHATREDYNHAYADLATIGFHTHVKTTEGKEILLPNTTTAGEFSGASASVVRDALTQKVKDAFAKRKFTSEIFISVGGDWAWSHRTTSG